METVFTSADQLIGATPMVALSRFENVLAKLESRNIAGSVKDRVAKAMLDDMEQSGHLKAGGHIIEPTSGSTGIALAALCAQRGYRCTIVMPETMSMERRQLIAAYGAQVMLSPAAEGMNGAIRMAEELAQQDSGSIIAGQFTNPANPHAHFTTTGPEIWQQTQGKVDIFVACVGTGGTLTGVGRYLKSQNPNVRIVAVEPAASAVLSGKPAGSHGIQGIGAGFIPSILDTTIIDEVITVTDEDAKNTARSLAAAEGILAGISSGAALWAAAALARREENKGKTIVTLFPDSGERYLSTGLFG